jgi:glucose/arabinose dehydrogenase
MALHPDFQTPVTAFIYFAYSYNSSASLNPVTKFKIARLTWNAATQTVTHDSTLVENMPTGYDHLGGRLMIIPQNSISYIFFTTGDNGVSEMNEPLCYSPQSLNPNNFAQDPGYKNGKIHRFNLDGSIPSDNPLPNNSFYTRGHRNPQGLMYNPVQNIIYDVEHGDRTDDEINILEKGMNYGWKYVRGFHGDNNYPGESAYVSGYTPYPGIANDALKEPVFTWCSTPQPTDATFLDWCTIAPSDGLYYGSQGIPDWTNSLLIVTLKNGINSDQQLFQVKLSADGKSILSSTPENPNPRMFFAADQDQNGRLRDIAVSPDGTKLYLINNAGNTRDKITVYTYTGPSGLPTQHLQDFSLKLYPNPTEGIIKIECTENLKQCRIYNVLGELLMKKESGMEMINMAEFAAGTYYLNIETVSGHVVFKKLLTRIR